MSGKKAYTFIELIITVIVISVIAALAALNFFRAMEQHYERDALLQIRIINNVLTLEKRMKKNYPKTNMNGLAVINTNLDLQIPASDYFNTYQYTYIPPDGPGDYTMLIGTTAGWSITYRDNTKMFYCSSGTPCPTCKSAAQGGCPQ